MSSVAASGGADPSNAKGPGKPRSRTSASGSAAAAGAAGNGNGGSSAAASGGAATGDAGTLTGQATDVLRKLLRWTGVFLTFVRTLPSESSGPNTSAGMHLQRLRPILHLLDEGGSERDNAAASLANDGYSANGYDDGVAKAAMAMATTRRTGTKLGNDCDTLIGEPWVFHGSRLFRPSAVR